MGRAFVRLVTVGLEGLFALAFQLSFWFQVLGLLTITDNSIPLLDKEDIISINSDGIKRLDGEPMHSHHLLLTSPLLTFSSVLLQRGSHGRALLLVEELGPVVLGCMHAVVWSFHVRSNLMLQIGGSLEILLQIEGWKMVWTDRRLYFDRGYLLLETQLRTAFVFVAGGFLQHV